MLACKWRIIYLSLGVAIPFSYCKFYFLIQLLLLGVEGFAFMA